MYPQNLPNSLNEYLRGEAKVFEALKSQLDNKWTVYCNVIWSTRENDSNYRDGETDFIISHPEFGILVVEVKGGMQIVYHPELDTWNSIDNNMSNFSIKNPYEQVRKNKYSLIDNLRTHGQHSRFNSFELNNLLNIRYAVIFPDVNRISTGNLPSYASLDITLFEHDINQNLLKRITTILKSNIVSKDNSKLFIESTHRELKSYLAPNFTLDRSLKYWLDDEEHQMLTLTEDQYNLLNVLQFVNKASIYGCAGSGKTLLAIKKAEITSNKGYRTLLVCFNNILGYHLSKSITNDNLIAGNFHKIIESILTQKHNKSFDLYNDQELLELVLMYDIPKFDSILIDEAQDFSQEQLDILTYLLKENGIIYYFWDSNQKVIRKDEYIPKDIPKFILEVNLRNTEYIFNKVKEHYKQDLNLKHKGPQGRSIQTLEPYNRKNSQELFVRLKNCLNLLIINEQLKPSDIVVLTFKAKKKSALIDFKYDKADLSIFEDLEHNDSIRIDTVRRFKGMESKVVIVTEMDDEQSLKYPELFNEMCYVSFSRAKNHLIILPYFV